LKKIQNSENSEKIGDDVIPKKNEIFVSGGSYDDNNGDVFVPTTCNAVEFLSPGVVHVITEDLPQLGPKQLLICTCCSLVSTGTELKIFRGHLGDFIAWPLFIFMSYIICMFIFFTYSGLHFLCLE
jgi:hypothetical protein